MKDVSREGGYNAQKATDREGPCVALCVAYTRPSIARHKRVKPPTVKRAMMARIVYTARSVL